MNSDLWAFDIETYHNMKSLEYDDTDVKAPGNYKDPDKIEHYIANARAKQIEKHPLYWWTGKIICIVARKFKSDEPQHVIFSGEDEKIILEHFTTFLVGDVCNTVHLIGKSSNHFDIPFIIGRYLANDMPIPNALTLRGWNECIDDLLSYSKHCDQRTSLKNYAFGLNIEGKSACAEQSLGWYRNILAGENPKENWDKIIGYCMQDVNIVWEFARRYYQ